MFIITLNLGFKLFIVDINFCSTSEQTSTKVSEKYDKNQSTCVSDTRLFFRLSPSTFRFE